MTVSVRLMVLMNVMLVLRDITWKMMFVLSTLVSVLMVLPVLRAYLITVTTVLPVMLASELKFSMGSQLVLNYLAIKILKTV